MKVAAALCLAALFVSCSSPSSSSSTTPVTPKAFTLTATVDGTTQFSGGATITIFPNGNTSVIDIKATSSSLGQSMELSFVSQSKVTAPVTLGPTSPGFVRGQYFYGDVGSNTVWLSGDTATATVDSFFVGPTDTTLAVDFSFAAWGGEGTGTATLKNVTAGRVRKN